MKRIIGCLFISLFLVGFTEVTNTMPQQENNKFEDYDAYTKYDELKQNTVYVREYTNAIQDEELSPTTVGKYGVQQKAIIASKNGYFPPRVIVRKNIPVRLYLTSLDTKSSCFVFKHGEYTFRKGIDKGGLQVVTFLPEETGPFPFTCPIGNIEGTLIVRD